MSRVFDGNAANFLESVFGTTATIPDYTIAVWAKFTTEAAATRSVWSTNSNGGFPHLRKFADGTQDLTIAQQANLTAVASGITVLNTWQHYAVVLAGASVTLYVDGVSVASPTGTPEGILTAITQFRLGLMTNGLDAYLGKIGRTSGWARALTAGEITALAAGGLPSAADSAARWFDYDPDTLTNQFTPAAGLTAGALTVTGSVAVDGADNPPVAASGATNLQFSVQPATTIVGNTMAAFTVQARTAANDVAASFVDNITISLFAGSGALLGTLVRAAVLGSATFTGISNNTLANAAIIRATSPGLTLIDSAPINFVAVASGGGGGSRIASRLVQ